jgi:hypothetical protein
LVGLVFALLGSWWLYRGTWKKEVAVGFLVIGSVLTILGLLFPRALVYPNRAWMRLAYLISLVTTPIILGFVYFLVLMPTGVIMKLSGIDPLRRRASPAPSYWAPYNPRQHDPHHFEKMY